MPVFCNSCMYIDCCPDCIDSGCCGKCIDCVCCKTGESTNFRRSDPSYCCCGLCKKWSCCECNDCRLKWCMCKCCSGNCIVDPLACCCGEYKGNLAYAEKDIIANGGAPSETEMVR